MESLVLLAIGILAVPFVLPLLSYLAARRVRRRVDALEERLDEQNRAIRELTTRIRQLSQAPPAAPPPVAAAPATEPVRVVPSPVVPPPPRVEPPVRPAAAPASAAPSTSAAAPASTAAPPRPPVPPRPVSLPPPPPPPSPPPTGFDWSFDWERLIGVKLFSAIAGVALVFAAVFFLRYSIEHGWLQPPVRVAIGVLTAIALLVVCELKAARRYPVTANAMDAAAIAILFATFFSAHSLWNLIPGTAAFVLLALVTATAVLLSIRRDSLFIAILGLVGGFSTPALLSTGENQPIPLFAYLLLLNIGLAWVAYRRGWAILSGASLVLTTVYQWGWVLRYLSESPLPLALGVFIVFAVVGFGGFILARSRPGTQAHANEPTFQWMAMASAVLPLFFAAYIAAVPAYGNDYALLFGYLFLVSAGLFAVALAMEHPELHALGAGATVVVFAVWLTFSYSAGSWPFVLGFVALFFALYLAAPGIAARVGLSLEGVGATAIYAAPVLLFALAALARVDAALAAPAPLFAALLAFVAVLVWRALATEDGALYYVGAFFAVAAKAVWSATHLTLERLPAALVIYGVFGAVYLGVPVLARRLDRRLPPEQMSGALLLASLALLWFLTTGPVAAPALWGLALLLAILNAAIFIESAATGLSMFSLAGSALSWILLLFWWMRAAGSVGVMPSLLVVVGLTLIMLAGYAWVHRRGARPAEGQLPFASGMWLALAGHLFLYTVALSPEWSLPPWPLFGALAVIVLSGSTASLAVRTPALHGASVVAASMVLIGWSTVARATGWGTVAVAAHVVLAGFALSWTLLSRRFAGDAKAAVAAGVVLVLAVADLMPLGAGGDAPLSVLLGANVTFITVLLALAAVYEWKYGATAIAVLAGLAVAAFFESAGRGGDAWRPLMAHGVAMYLPFAIYPLVLGRRASGHRDPYVAALIASAWCFFATRHAVMQTDYARIVGVVPVVLGAITTLHVRTLLQIERPGERDLGRLALVAGGALAFLTVAIPLQLSQQWITIGWALEGAAVAWLFRRVPHRGLLYAAVGLLGAVFVRLAANPEVLNYEPRGSMRILNWYLYAYAICAAAMFLAAWWLSKTEDRLHAALPPARHLLSGAGGLVLFVLLNIEIADFYATGPDEMFEFGVSIAQDLTYTIGWLLFGLVTLAAGIALRARAARVAAVALITVTTLKCFLYDLGSLGGLYRVGAFVGLAMSLALVSLALQKYVLASREAS